jgi:hypothetical protein
MDYTRPSYKDRAYDRRVSPRSASANKGATHLDNCRIEFAALDKLFIRQLGVLIFVHVLEDLVHSLNSRGVSRQIHNLSAVATGIWTGSDLFGSVLVFGELDHLIGHLVNSPYDLEHLIVGDRPIAVDVVELEGP